MKSRQGFKVKGLEVGRRDHKQWHGVILCVSERRELLSEFPPAHGNREDLSTSSSVRVRAG